MFFPISRLGSVRTCVLAGLVLSSLTLAEPAANKKGPIFTFHNGTKVYNYNPSNQNRAGLFVQVGGNKLSTFLDKTEVQLVKHQRANDKIAMTYTNQGDFYVVTVSGAGKKIGTLDRSRLRTNFDHWVYRLDWNGKQYWVIHFYGKEAQDKGQVYIVNEGSEIINYSGEFSLTPGTEPKVQNGVLMLDPDKLVDLGAFKVLEPAEKHYANGAKLVSQPGWEVKIRYVSPITTKNIVQGGSVQWQPLQVEVTSAIKRRENIPLNIDLVMTKKAAQVITADGSTSTIVFDPKTPVLTEGGTLLTPLQVGFVSENKHYLLVSFGIPPAKESEFSVGETYLLDEAGNVVMIDRKRHSKFDYTIVDGIFRLKNSPREEIDLRCMEGEAFFVPQAVKGTIKTNGDTPTDLNKFVTENFTNFADKVQANPKDSYELDSDRSADLQAALLMDGGSAAITGPAGSGKTQVMKDFVSAVKRGVLPGFPRTTRFLELRPTQLNQGTTLIGIIDTRVEALIETSKVRPTILITDEVHSLRGIGTHSGNQNDIFEYLKPPIGEGTVRLLAGATDYEFDEAFGGDQALLRRVVRVPWPVPDAKKAAEMAEEWMLQRGYFPASDDLTTYAVELSERLDAVGAQPSKVIKLLRYAYGVKRTYGDFGKELSRDDLEMAATALYKLDPDTFSPERMQLRVNALRGFLDSRIAGQEGIKERLEMLTRQKVYGLTPVDRIAMSMLFAGPPGSGKTTLAKAYAEGMGFRFAKIDMTEFTEYDSPQKFKFRLAAEITKNPYCVILLDELEKCSREVQQTLLTIMTDGQFETYRALGSTSRKSAPVMINARNVFLLGTTNAGSVEVERGGQGFGFDARASAEIVKEGRLRGAVAAGGVYDALVDRFDDVLPAPSAPAELIPNVVEIQVRDYLQVLLKGPFKDVELDFTNQEEFVKYVAARVAGEAGSNRDIKRMIERMMAQAFTEWMTQNMGKARPGKLNIKHHPDAKNGLIIECAQELAEIAAA